MALADPDLRHGIAAAPARHLGAPLGLQVDAHLLEVAHALLREQPFRRLAERAGRGEIHQDPSHNISTRPRYFSTGSPACFQAPSPPARLTTPSNPCFPAAAPAFAARSP